MPADERERLAKDAFVERLGLNVEMAEAGNPSSQVSVSAGPLQNVRGIFDLMPTEGEEAQRTSPRGWPPSRRRWTGGSESLRDAAQQAGRRPAQLVEVAQANGGRHWTGADGDNFSASWPAGSTPDDTRRETRQRRGRRRAAYAEFGRFLR